MVREDVKFKLRAVRQYVDGHERAEDICHVFGPSKRTLQRRSHCYWEDGIEGFKSKSAGV